MTSLAKGSKSGRSGFALSGQTAFELAGVCAKILGAARLSRKSLTSTALQLQDNNSQVVTEGLRDDAG